MALTALQVRNAKPGRHPDGKGLYLFVKPTGAKSWVLRVQANGRRRDFGLGPVDLVPLSEAREKAIQGRRMVRDGLDPSLEWKRRNDAVPTFAEAARRYYGNIKGGFRNARHSASWLSSLEAYAFPLIGSKPVDQIDTPAIQSVLLPIWLMVPETARRVRQRIGAVLDFAHGQGWRSVEAPMRAVSKGLPNQPRKGEHFAAMPYSEVPELMQSLAGKSDTIGRLALRFTILTAARSGETRGATWDEIDLEAKVWSIPGARMKAGQPHAVPLPDAAVDILKTMAGFIAGHKGELVFKGVTQKPRDSQSSRDQTPPLSDMTLTKALRDAGVKDYTVHGFRSSFRDWAAEQTSFPGEWAEAALAHALPNKVEAAYRRTKFLDQRRKMMNAWASYVDGSPANVLSLVKAG